MKIIIVDSSLGGSKTIALKGWLKLGLGLCLLGLPVLIGYGAYLVAEARAGKAARDVTTTEEWNEALQANEAAVVKAKQEAASRLEALTIRLANLQARLVRLDALGEKLSTVTGLSKDEFDFSADPATGGPEILQNSAALQVPDFIAELNKLTQQIDARQQQLEALNAVMTERQSLAEFDVSGWPIKEGYISSGFGTRLDPISGKKTSHDGIDFNTRTVGHDVFAVAAGVVSYVGWDNGYGNTVKIDHGNGYETLYAHDKKILVKEGDVVKKGQVIALSGTTGRTTGPHVHFEVHKNGRVVDPASYIKSTIR